MSISGDMLKGAAAIAVYTGFDEREIYRCHETRALPTFNVGRHICARKSELDAWLSGRRARGGALDALPSTMPDGEAEASSLAVGGAADWARPAQRKAAGK